MTALTPLPSPTEAGPLPDPVQPMLRSRVVRASMWAAAGFIASNVIRLARSLILAHLLVPKDFGVVALAASFMQGLQMLSDLGVAPSIIQSRRGEDAAFLRTAWTIQVIRGTLLWLGACALAWPVARFYDHPELFKFMPIIGLSAILDGLNSTVVWSLNRRLAVGRLMLLNLGESCIGLAAMWVWAKASPGVMALVGGTLIARASYTAATHILLAGPRMAPHWDREAVHSIIHFGRWIFVSTIVTFFAMQADRLMLGKIALLDLVGVYSIALTFTGLPLEVGSRLVEQVLFPVLAHHAREEPHLLGARVRASRRLILPAGVVCSLGLLLAAPWFFRLLYPPQYHDAGWMSALLSVSVWLTILQQSADRTLLALGDTRALALSNALNLAVKIPAALAGNAIAGLPGFILGLAAGALAGHIVVQVAMLRHAMPILRQDLGFTAILIAGAAGGILVPMLLVPRLPAGAAPWVQAGIAGVVLTAACIWAAQRTWEGIRRR